LLTHRFAVTDTSLSWFQSYLGNRTQSCLFTNHCTAPTVWTVKFWHKENFTVVLTVDFHTTLMKWSSVFVFNWKAI